MPGGMRDLRDVLVDEHPPENDRIGGCRRLQQPPGGAATAQTRDLIELHAVQRSNRPDSARSRHGRRHRRSEAPASDHMPATFDYVKGQVRRDQFGGAGCSAGETGAWCVRRGGEAGDDNDNVVATNTTTMNARPISGHHTSPIVCKR